MEEILVPIGLCVALPCIIVWLTTRKRMHEADKRTEIVLAAIEKNTDIDVEEFVKSLTPGKKDRTLEERCWGVLLAGYILFFVGLLLDILFVVMLAVMKEDDLWVFIILSSAAMMTGLACLLAYRKIRRIASPEPKA